MRGSELTPWLIRYGYERGAFPMTMEDGSVEWFQPRTRALFPLTGVHLSKNTKRKLKKGTFEIRFDSAFQSVMRGCLRPGENWISEDFIRVYTQIHHEGWAHCCETWSDGQLVGGVYGLALGSCFCAESMFHRKDDGSKIALWAMVERCRELGFTIFDAQVMNPHLESLGAVPISHAEYMQMFEEALRTKTEWS